MVAIDERIKIHESQTQKQILKRIKSENAFKKRMRNINNKIQFYVEAIDNLEKKKTEDPK